MRRYLILATLLLTSITIQAAPPYHGGLKPTPIPEDKLMQTINPRFSQDAFFIGRDYHHNTFRDRKKGLQGLADCNFTIADCADPQDIKLCEKLGLNVVASIAPHLFGNQWAEMSDEQIDAYVKDFIERCGRGKAILGYHICDEPSSTAFPALAKAVAAVRKYAPGKWSTINLYPNYATIWTENQIKSQLGTRTYMEYLERFVAQVKPDLITYDNYMVQMSQDMKEPQRAVKYYTNLLDVRTVSVKYDIPFWNVVSGNQVRPTTPLPSPANLALQAYTSLAAGAHGIRWFTYWKGGYNYAPIDENENRTLTWRYLQEVNRQTLMLGTIMRKMRSTGVYFTQNAYAGLPKLPGEYVRQITSEVPMMVGEFLAPDASRYVMVVNMSLERSARFEMTTKNNSEKRYIVAIGEDKPYLQDYVASAMSSLDGEMGWRPKTAQEVDTAIWLPAGEGVLIKCMQK